MYALLAFGLVLSVGSSRGAEKSRAKAEELSLKNALTKAMSKYNGKLKAALSETTKLIWTKVNQLSKTVGFTARFVNDKVDGFLIGHRAILRFDDVLYNAGNGYDPHTGIFTAPVAGTYSFFLNLMGHTEGHLEMVKNGVRLDSVWGNGGNDQGASQVLVHLEDGGKVWVKQVDIRSLRGGPYTVFTGYLLQAD